jgi:UDP-N-acetylmuramate dehydrogenase
VSAGDLDVRERVPLASLTTFRVGGPARYLAVCRRTADIPSALEFAAARRLPFCVLGGGSNVLVADRGFEGVVVKIETQGVERLESDSGEVRLRVAAGEDWDALVARCVDQGWWGIENLSLIPGTAGAVPIQNVGAYGQEAGETIESVEVWNVEDRKWTALSNSECGLGYRSSVFTQAQAGRYVVSQVVFRLSIRGEANVRHVSVASRLKQLAGGESPTPARMRECIVALRTDGRLPDVRTTGSAGSFFKNVFLGDSAFDRLRHRVGESFGAEAGGRIESIGRTYRAEAGFKIPAGELVRLCGLAGIRVGGAGLHPANPTVVVNATGSATAADILRLALEVGRSVRDQTGIHLEPEPRFIGFRPVELDLWGCRDAGGGAADPVRGAGLPPGGTPQRNGGG